MAEACVLSIWVSVDSFSVVTFLPTVCQPGRLPRLTVSAFERWRLFATLKPVIAAQTAGTPLRRLTALTASLHHGAPSVLFQINH